MALRYFTSIPEPQTGVAKRMRISQRMSQHIMQLTLALRMAAPPFILHYLSG